MPLEVNKQVLERLLGVRIRTWRAGEKPTGGFLGELKLNEEGRYIVQDGEDYRELRHGDNLTYLNRGGRLTTQRIR